MLVVFYVWFLFNRNTPAVTSINTFKLTPLARSTITIYRTFCTGKPRNSCYAIWFICILTILPHRFSFCLTPHFTIRCSLTGWGTTEWTFPITVFTGAVITIFTRRTTNIPSTIRVRGTTTGSSATRICRTAPLPGTAARNLCIHASDLWVAWVSFTNVYFFIRSVQKISNALNNLP